MPHSVLGESIEGAEVIRSALKKQGPIGLAATRFYTNETIFDVEALPGHLVVIGAGAVGLELGQAFRRFGSSVTVLDQSIALAGEDRDLADAVVASLARDGVSVRENTAVTGVGPLAHGVRLTLQGPGRETIDATHVLVAVGRAPRVEGLGLDAAGIAYGKGGIKVGKDLRTSNRRVFALGDVIGGGSTGLANLQAGLLARRVVFRLPVRLHPELAPRALYTSPELAAIGLNETQARARHGKIAVMRAAFADNDRARTARVADGFVKIIADRRGRVLGAAIVGEAASELIAPFALALRKGMRVHDLRDMALAYPTRAEAIKRAALGYFLPELAKPRLARFVRFLHSWG